MQVNCNGPYRPGNCKLPGQRGEKRLAEEPTSSGRPEKRVDGTGQKDTRSQRVKARAEEVLDKLTTLKEKLG